MAKCKDCKGWGFAGLQSYNEPLPRLIYSRDAEGKPHCEDRGPGKFAPEFVPLRNCDTCGGSGIQPERRQVAA